MGRPRTSECDNTIFLHLICSHDITIARLAHLINRRYTQGLHFGGLEFNPEAFKFFSTMYSEVASPRNSCSLSSFSAIDFWLKRVLCGEISLKRYND